MMNLFPETLEAPTPNERFETEESTCQHRRSLPGLNCPELKISWRMFCQKLRGWTMVMTSHEDPPP